MAPKKGTKMTLSDFLADGPTGKSWADEVEDLPSAPAPRGEGDRGRRDDFSRDFSGREGRYPPRDELPLPTKPPYTAFLGNLAYDLTDADVEEFFAPHKLISVKIIKEREGDRPKGFGYVEFADLEGLKAGLDRSNTSLSNRVVRVSVAEGQKDRAFGSRGGFGEDDEKFDKQWRRDGPLPDLAGDDRSSSRARPSRFSGDREPTNEADDWRSAPRAMQAPMDRGAGPGGPGGPSRRGSGFSTPSDTADPADWRGSRPPRANVPEGEGARSRPFTPREQREPRDQHAADTEENWTMGSKFKKNSPPPSESGFGPSRRGSRDNVPARQPSGDEEISDWRTAPRKALPTREGRFGERLSPQSSTPPTPASRKKLELLPRGNNSPSAPSSPLTSPPPTSATLPSVKSNPFGDAKPIDVSAREREIEEKLAAKPAHGPHAPAPTPATPSAPSAPAASAASAASAAPSPARAPSARQETWRRGGPPSDRVTPSHSRQPSSGRGGGSRDASRAATPPKDAPKKPITPPPTDASASRVASNVRPTFSFAAAAASISIDEEGPEADLTGGDETEAGHANGVRAVSEKLANLATDDSIENAVKDSVQAAAQNGGVTATESDVEKITSEITAA